MPAVPAVVACLYAFLCWLTHLCHSNGPLPPNPPHTPPPPTITTTTPAPSNTSLSRASSCVLQEARQRLLSPGGKLTEEETARIREVLSAMPLTGGGTTGNLSAATAAA